jgi:hypothetical protein
MNPACQAGLSLNGRWHAHQPKEVVMCNFKQPLGIFYKCLEVIERWAPEELREELLRAAQVNSEDSWTEHLHKMVSIFNMLAKKNKEFYKMKGFILETLVCQGDGRVNFWKKGEVFFLWSHRYGVTTYHHTPKALERILERKMATYPWEWMGYHRQELAIREALEDAVRLDSIKKSTPPNFRI